MLRVSFGSSVRTGTNLPETVELSAENIEELVGQLRDRYLGLDGSFGKDVAFAINGEIYRDDWTQSLPDGAEIFLMPRIEGG
tara:strand:- start:344 stop:589 length:246 start_codon:yes stop_codon:yes gene_type:complete